jgi:hypothetical protein
MDRKLLFLSLAFTSLTSFGQTMFGGRLGANYSIYSSKEGDDVPSGATVETESVSGIGFHVGLCFQYNFSRHVGIRRRYCSRCATRRRIWAMTMTLW